MNADVKATCLAALDEHRSLLTVVACLDDDHPDVAAIDKALAALEVDAPQGSWQPVIYSTFVEDQSYNDTYVLITLGGSQLEIGTDPTQDGRTVNLPSYMRLCRRVDNPAPQVSEGMSQSDARAFDAMDKLLDRLIGIFDDDANNMPEQLLDYYIEARTWLDAQPVGWDDNPAPSEAMVGVDWSSAPAEAMFYAINSGGVEVYFEYEPIRYDADGYWDAPIDPNKKGRVLGARWQGNEIDLPLGVDWRTTLQRRPAGEGL